MSKTIGQSKTMITGITTAVTSLTAIIMHFSGIAVLYPAVLGGSISALITAVVFCVLRMNTSQPIGSGKDEPKKEPTIMSCVFLIMTVFIALGMQGCVRHFKAKKTVDISIIKKPCKVTVKSDGELVFKLTGPIECGVKK